MDIKKTLTLSNGVEIPRISFGCAFGNWTNKEDFMGFQPDLAWSAIQQALSSGYTHYDTALIYGTHKILGNLLGQNFASGRLKREEIYIKTKIFHPQTPLALNEIGHTWDMNNRDIDIEKRVRHDIERCLDELNLGYIDMIVLHWPGDWNTTDIKHGDFMRQKVWAALEKVYLTGRVRAIGVSNFLEKHFNFLNTAEIKPMLNQIEISPYIQQTSTTEFCKKQGIAVEAWAPFGSGTTGVIKDPCLNNLSSKYNKNVGQIILRWLTQKGFAAIPKSSNLSRMKSNLEIYDFNISDEDMLLIDSLDKNKSSVTTSESIA